MKITNAKFGMACSIPGLTALIALVIYPIFYNFYVSFLRYNNITPIKFNGFENYVWLFSSSDFYQSLKVSIIYSLGSTTFAFILGLILTCSLRRIKKARTLSRTLTVLPWAIPLIVSAFMWKWILNRETGVLNFILSSFNLVDNKVSFISDPTLAMISGILATSYRYVPFIVVYLLAGLESIPLDLYEAAKVDGADHLQQFWYISVPLIKGQMIFSFTLVMMFTLRIPDIFFGLTMGGPGKATYHLGLFLRDTIYKYLNFGHGATIGVILFVIIISFAFPLLYRAVIKGK